MNKHNDKNKGWRFILCQKNSITISSQIVLYNIVVIDRSQNSHRGFEGNLKFNKTILILQTMINIIKISLTWRFVHTSLNKNVILINTRLNMAYKIFCTWYIKIFWRTSSIYEKNRLHRTNVYFDVDNCCVLVRAPSEHSRVLDLIFCFFLGSVASNKTLTKWYGKFIQIASTLW